MVHVDGVRRPVVAEEQCIGCGKCEFLCPSRPVSAITVKGLETHISK
jgi:NAD-dependent dihydropyrimidine dehydrogenase PreA subunit